MVGDLDHIPARSESGIKKGLSALVSLAKETVAPPEEPELQAKHIPGPPIYESIRRKTDQ